MLDRIKYKGMIFAVVPLDKAMFVGIPGSIFSSYFFSIFRNSVFWVPLGIIYGLTCGFLSLLHAVHMVHAASFPFISL